MGKIIDFGSVLVGIVLVTGIALAFGNMYLDVATTYSVTQTEATLANQEAFVKSQNLTNTISDNVRELGIQDESSASKVISVGFNSWKLFLAAPSIVSGFVQSFDNVLVTKAYNIDFATLGLMVLIISILWTIVYSLLFGRA